MKFYMDSAEHDKREMERQMVKENKLRMKEILQ